MKREGRLTALEENSYFQEERLNRLEEAVLEQGRQIGTMKRELLGLRKNLAALRDEIGAQGPANEPPPHYNQQK